jgi:hypothetical protein
VNDEDLTRSLRETAGNRVRNLDPRPDVDELMTRLERRSNRQRGILLAIVVPVLVIGGVAGYLLGSSTDEGATPSAVVALDDGVPASPALNGHYVPVNVDAARNDIASAFHDAFDGNVTNAVRAGAVQDGQTIQFLNKESQRLAQRFGFTPEQLAGTTISVLDTSFIDDTHAVVHFTLAVPGHGVILAERVGYAVLTDGRWQVALRTACDLLSLSGLGRQCPPGR